MAFAVLNALATIDKNIQIYVILQMVIEKPLNKKQKHVVGLIAQRERVIERTRVRVNLSEKSLRMCFLAEIPHSRERKMRKTENKNTINKTRIV